MSEKLSGFANFSGLITGTWATYQSGVGGEGGWPDGNASEEYQTQSYFCYRVASWPSDGSQDLPESPAAHLNKSSHSETTHFGVYVFEPKVSPSS